MPPRGLSGYVLVYRHGQFIADSTAADTDCRCRERWCRSTLQFRHR